MKPLLTVKQLRVRYGPIVAVDGIDLEVGEGELVVLLGSNGAGKSSLLRALSGLESATGEIRLGDRELHRLAAAERARAGLVHVPEGRGIFAPLTVEENLRLGCLWRSGHDAESALADALQRFPILRGRLSQPAGTMSGGEQQMLALARALCQAPRLLLLDEPSLGLSPQMTTNVFATIVEIHRRGTAMLMVEQNANLALGVADRGYVLSHGAIVQAGSASALAQSDEVKKAYLGVV